MLNYIENTMTMSMEKESRGLRLDHYGSIEKGKSQAKSRGKRNQVNGFFFPSVDTIQFKIHTHSLTILNYM